LADFLSAVARDDDLAAGIFRRPFGDSAKIPSPAGRDQTRVGSKVFIDADIDYGWGIGQADAA
jgi:hypothetical protein